MYNTPKRISYFLPSAISGGAAIIGGAIDAINNSAMQKRAIAAQKNENQLNRDYAVQMYKEFESPQAQVQQLAAAGINPYSNGAVSTNSVGSASTSSLPTPLSSTFGSSIAEGVQNAVQSYTQRKQFQQQLDADALNQTRNFLLELSKLELDERELEVQMDLWSEQIKASKTSREYQDLINTELRDFLDSGRNRLAADFDLKTAQLATEEALRDGKVTQLDLDNAARSFNLELEKDFGYKFKNLDYQLSRQQFYLLKSQMVDENATRKMRYALMKAGLDEAQAKSIITATQSSLDTLDYNYYKTLVGDGNDWYSPLGNLLYALWNKDGIAIKK